MIVTVLVILYNKIVNNLINIFY